MANVIRVVEEVLMANTFLRALLPFLLFVGIGLLLWRSRRRDIGPYLFSDPTRLCVLSMAILSALVGSTVLLFAPGPSSPPLRMIGGNDESSKIYATSTLDWYFVGISRVEHDLQTDFRFDSKSGNQLAEHLVLFSQDFVLDLERIEELLPFESKTRFLAHSREIAADVELRAVAPLRGVKVGADSDSTEDTRTSILDALTHNRGRLKALKAELVS